MKKKMETLEDDTECWICKRTERDIIAEVKDRKWSKDIIGEIRKENKWKENVRTKGGLISLENVGTLGFSYPLCAICAGLIDSISDNAIIEWRDYEAHMDTQQGAR